MNDNTFYQMKKVNPIIMLTNYGRKFNMKNECVHCTNCTWNNNGQLILTIDFTVWLIRGREGNRVGKKTNLNRTNYEIKRKIKMKMELALCTTYLECARYSFMQIISVFISSERTVPVTNKFRWHFGISCLCSCFYMKHSH